MNFDKNFAKYYCKKLQENYVDLLKIEKKNKNATVSDFLACFFKLIQRKYILNEWKKLDDSTRKISSLEETISVANQCDTE